MLSFLIRLLQDSMRLIRDHDSPQQWAAGFTLGALIGLMPKSNLIAVTLCVVVGTFKVSKSAACLGVVLFMWLGVATDPVAHTIGESVLGIAALQDAFTFLYNMPLGPWIGFNNTVVLGSLLMGIYFAYPIFWLSYAAMRAIKHLAVQRARRRELHRMITDMKIGAPWGIAA